MHSYEGPSGRTYHHESEGSPSDVIYFEFDTAQQTAEISIEDILWIAARVVRGVRVNEIDNMSDVDILGLPKEYM